MKTAAMVSSSKLTPALGVAEFSRYVEGMDLQDTHRGIQGIGFAALLSEELWRRNR